MNDWNLRKSKGAELPQIRRPTLQSQFSQGESMNGLILNSSSGMRVAKTLRGTCKHVFRIARKRSAARITKSIASWFSLTGEQKRHKNQSSFPAKGLEDYRKWSIGVDCSNACPLRLRSRS